MLWHRVIADIAGEFRFDARYQCRLCRGVSARAGCFIPVVVEDGATPPALLQLRTGAWFGWGITLYLLGFALATQVAQIADGLSAA